MNGAPTAGIKRPRRDPYEIARKLEEMVRAAETGGREFIHYTEVARALGISNQYAHHLLKDYAAIKGYPFAGGRIFLVKRGGA